MAIHPHPWWIAPFALALVAAALALSPATGDAEVVCPTALPPESGCPPLPQPIPTDTPQLSGFRVAPKRFRVAAGASLKLTLSAPGAVTFTIEQKPTCEPGQTCPQFIRVVNGFTRSLPAGPSSIAYSGHYRKGGKVRTLDPGGYLVEAVPRGRDGAEGATRSAGFTVLR
jgi:hypothetical protein